jgi:septum formation protein
MKIVLASASPRRKQLLSQLGVSFSVMVSDKEGNEESTDPSGLCLLHARQKAYDIVSALQPVSEPTLVIGADTVVSAGGEILGKPKDDEDARRMLRKLSGNTHQVLTGVCAVSLPDGKETAFADTTDVSVTEMTESQMEEYIKSREPFDKAGGYGIQGEFAKYVTGIRGDYSNVVGLPAGRVWRECIEPFEASVRR